MTPIMFNRPIVRTRNLSNQRFSRWLSPRTNGLSSTTIRSNRSNMGKRFLIALLSILISGLKFVINMLTIGISFLTKKNIPMVEDWIPNNLSEKDESLKRSIYVVEHNENPQVEWGEYNPKIKDIRTHKNITRDLLDQFGGEYRWCNVSILQMKRSR